MREKLKKLTSILISLAVLPTSGCVNVIPSVLGEVVLDTQLIEQTIEQGIWDQAGVAVTAECPSQLSGKPGDVRQCTVEDEFGQISLVDITIQNLNGDITWQVQ